MQSDKAKFKDEFNTDPKGKEMKYSWILNCNFDLISLILDISVGST
jgi:hypothetical protein